MRDVQVEANDIAKIAMDLLRSTASEGTPEQAVARAWALTEEYLRTAKGAGHIRITERVDKAREG